MMEEGTQAKDDNDDDNNNNDNPGVWLRILP